MKIPKSLYNWVSITGALLVINAAVIIIALFIVIITSENSYAYLGIFTYIVVPGIMIIGLVLIPLGMFFRLRKKETLQSSDESWPVLDLNSRKQRKSLMIFSIISVVFIMVSSMGSYRAFQYTESLEFCGKLCHTVMEPEFVTYSNSPHARVVCVECHVGEGADWYVKSKMSGLYQVYSVIFNKYSKPIGTPLKNLRPARETCERCHWPEKFYSRKLRNQKVFLTDSTNSEYDISLLMKIGPTYSAMGLKEGIHWHINKNVKIEYVASTENRESIPWVRYTNLKTNEVQIFQDSSILVDQKGLDTLEVRPMDCMDCHNRPSHNYKSPMVYIDNALTSGVVSKELPFIKKVAMDILKNQFGTKDSAFTYIRDSITSFYKVNYPALYASKKELIDRTIEGIQIEFSKNTFPLMKANFSSYNNHIGHLESEGCFRCHNDKHVSAKGKVISKDCNWCHTIIAQGFANQIKTTSIIDTLQFIHPVDIGDSWRENSCTECHRFLYP
jgi:hypothetical protein